VLGLELYGMVVFAETVVFYFMIAINFGFEMSATKQISINRSNPKKVSEIVSSVYIIKGILLLVCALLYYLMINIVPKFAEYNLLFAFSFLFCLQEILIPVWYFQGIEKMMYITIIDVLSRLTYILFIILFVREKGDYLLVPLFHAAGVILAGILSTYLVFYKGKIKFQFVDKSCLKYYFKDGLPFFFSRYSTLINDKTNTLLIGIFLGMREVSYYDFVYKIMSAITSLFGIFVKAIYPHIAQTRNLLKSKKVLNLNIGISIISYILLILLSKKIIILLVGVDMMPAQPLFYLLGLMLPLVAMDWSLGDLYLAAMGYNRIFSLSSIYSTLVYLIIISVLYFLNFINLLSLVATLLMRLFFLDIYRFYYCQKYHLIK
jgi:PST family polysaccharide transporter